MLDNRSSGADCQMGYTGAESPQPAPWGSSAYFIWLAPSPAYAEADALSELLKSLQEQTGTPVFSPHVTLYRALPSQCVFTLLMRFRLFLSR